MQRILLSILAVSHSRLDGTVLIDTLKKLGYDTEKRYVSSQKDAETSLLECLIEPMIEMEIESMGIEVTNERVEYMIKDLIEGDSINLPLLDELKEQVFHAVQDRKIEMEAMK